jgi:hypothetical protein
MIKSLEWQTRYVTGGLGKLMTVGEYEVWLCDTKHECAPEGDMMCFTFNEKSMVFSPLGLNSDLQFVETSDNFSRALSFCENTNYASACATEAPNADGVSKDCWETLYRHFSGAAGAPPDADLVNQECSCVDPTASNVHEKVCAPCKRAIGIPCVPHGRRNYKKSESSPESWKLSRKSSSPVAKPVWKVSAKKRMSHDVRDSLLMDDSIKPAIMGSSEEAHMRHNLIMSANTPPIWTPPWVPGGDLKELLQHMHLPPVTWLLSPVYTETKASFSRA